MTTAYAWAPITKVEDQDDGTVVVYGPATDAGLDRDKQRMNQDWLDAAMPAWMAEGGNVREQHDAKRAVGVGVGLSRAEDGSHMLAAAVVDPVAIMKVRPGPNGRPPVLKGFSVGIKDPQLAFGKADAPNGEIIGGSIIEVSLVDRPSNPRTLFTMVKADAAGDLGGVDGAAVVEKADDPRAVQARAVAAEVTVLVPDLSKADGAAGDVADALTAIACIARLIQSEAASLAAGNLDEDCDISTLLQAVAAMKYFIACESAEPSTTGDAGEVADSMSVTGDTYMADAVKTETPPAAPATAPPAAPATTTPDLTKVDNAGMAAIVKAAVAEATAPLRDELALVKADVVKALAMPEPGGPVGMRTASQAAAARGADRLTLHAQADQYLAKADTVSREDPLLAAGYREKAADLRTKADA